MTGNPATGDLGTRVQGIAACLVSEEDVRNEVCQRALHKIEGMLSSSTYLRKVVRSVAVDYYREHKREVPLAPEFELPAPPPCRPPKPPPLEVIEERLRILYAGGESHPHEALVFAYHVHLEYSPADIVANLARIPLADLAHNYVVEYSRVSRVPMSRVRSLFPDLLALAETPAGRTQLADYWDPATVVKSWIRAPEPREESAHRRIAYIFHVHLGYEPARIVMRLGPRTLEELAVQFMDEFAEAEGCTPIEARDRFRDMVQMNAVAAGRPLAFYFSPARAVAHWVHSVYRRLESAEAAREKAALKLLYGCGASHEMLAFLATFILGMASSELARFGGQRLSAIAQKLVPAYARRRDVAEEQVESWIRPLRKQIELAGDPLLRDCRGTAEEISRWRGEVLGRFLPRVRVNPELALFTHRYGLAAAQRRVSCITA